MLRRLDRPPAVGDEFIIEELSFEVLEVEGHRIKKLSIKQARHSRKNADAEKKNTEESESQDVDDDTGSVQTREVDK